MIPFLRGPGVAVGRIPMRLSSQRLPGAAVAVLNRLQTTYVQAEVS